MRQIGKLTSAADAQRLADYLLTQGVAVRVDAADTEHAVWALDENDVERARSEFALFQQAPTDARYNVASQAAELRRSAATARRKAQGNVVDVSKQWRFPNARRAPWSMGLIVASVVLTLLCNFGKNHELQNWFDLSSGLAAVTAGQIWRLWTPALLHLSWIHLIFNMYWVYVLGGVIELRRGPLVLMALVLVSAPAGVLGEFLWSGGNACGMSGVVYAFFGYAWMQGRYNPAGGLWVPPQTVFLMLFWLVLCMSGSSGFGSVANTAHVAGLAVGAAAGFGSAALRR